MDQKITNESSSGKGVGDLVHTGTDVIGWANDGLLTSFSPVGAKGVPAGLKDPDGNWVASQYGAIGFLINTSLMKASDAPQNWSDLTKAKYSGKFALTKPSTPGSLEDTIATLVYSGDLDKDTLTRIKDNKPLVTGATDLTVQAVTSGQVPVGVGVGLTSYVQAKQSGAPVAFVFPFNGGPTPLVVTNMAVLKSAPDPNAAKLLEAWLLTPEAMKAIPAAGVYGVLKGSPAPSGMPTLDGANVVLPPPASKIADNTKSTIAMLSSVFGK